MCHRDSLGFHWVILGVDDFADKGVVEVGDASIGLIRLYVH